MEEKSKDTLVVFAEVCEYKSHVFFCSGAERPYREDFLSKLESDGNKVVKEIIFGPGQKKYRFCKATLRGLCDDLGIPFQAAMLRWESGPKPFDGMWAPYWYKNTHKSTGFEPPRKYPSVSVFDSVVQGGDAVWEGLRIYNGKIFKLEEHLDRLFDSAKALAFSNVPTREYVTSGMSPAFNLYGCTLIVLAEWKPPVYDNERGINLVTATTRRNSPNIEGNNSHADDAIMLDKDGYVSETNATNIFLVKKGHVATPSADYCLPGITRATVMELVVKENLVLVERHISLSEFHTADEVFTTGTMGELSPAIEA
ncbi:UNVERIFIED_CONTAM: Branched-chain-amino-acid aminotransferase-like protein 2 [Sesamum angustifolium]|uniref:Branched-chain-amino-acid aminotransferase-like protein 2 n=1 Tax=Sesamum angustifolium TaxID=2727405 RepID=A0AAW2IVF1_9LAMI